MSEKTVSDLPTEFTGTLPTDLFLSAHSASLGPGKVKPSAVGGGGGSSGPPLATTNPLPNSSSPSVGISTEAARADHVHQKNNAGNTNIAPAGGITSSNVQAAIYELDTDKIETSLINAPNGVAPLDAAALLPVSKLPVTIPAAKTLVAAIGSVPQADLQSTIGSLDSRITALTQSLTLAGTYNASANLVDALSGTGLVDGALPAPGAGNANKYLIVNVTGTGIGNAAGLGTLEQGNWLYSDGSAWIELVINSGAIAASTVSVTPAGNIAANNVQNALVELDTEKVATTRIVVGQQSITGGGALTGDANLQLAGDEATPGANKVYGTNASGNKGWKADPSGGGGTVTKPRFLIQGSSLPLLTPAVRTYVSGIAGNGVQYPAFEFPGGADGLVDLFGAVPAAYGNGELSLTFSYTCKGSAGIVTWSAAFCNITGSLALDAAFTFAFQSVNSSPPSTVGLSSKVTIPFTRIQADSLSAGNPFVLRIKRPGSDTNTNASSLLFWSVQVEEV